MTFPVKFYNAETVTVQTLTSTQNDMGEVISDWVASSTIDAEIWPLTGKQLQYEAGVTEKSTHKGYSLMAFQSNTQLVTPYGTFLVGYIQNWHGFYTAILELVT